MSNNTALAEARGLYLMLDTGHTLEELRECIGVPPNIERALRPYANKRDGCTMALFSKPKWKFWLRYNATGLHALP